MRGCGTGRLYSATDEDAAVRVYPAQAAEAKLRGLSSIEVRQAVEETDLYGEPGKGTG